MIGIHTCRVCYIVLLLQPLGRSHQLLRPYRNKNSDINTVGYHVTSENSANQSGIQMVWKDIFNGAYWLCTFNVGCKNIVCSYYWMDGCALHF